MIDTSLSRARESTVARDTRPRALAHARARVHRRYYVDKISVRASAAARTHTPVSLSAPRRGARRARGGGAVIENGAMNGAV